MKKKKHFSTYLASPKGQTVTAGKWISSIETCRTEVITGCFCQASKLLWMIHPAETIPRQTIKPQTHLDNADPDAMQK